MEIYSQGLQYALKSQIQVLSGSAASLTKADIDYNPSGMTAQGTFLPFKHPHTNGSFNNSTEVECQYIEAKS